MKSIVPEEGIHMYNIFTYIDIQVCAGREVWWSRGGQQLPACIQESLIPDHHCICEKYTRKECLSMAVCAHTLFMHIYSCYLSGADVLSELALVLLLALTNAKHALHAVI
jgi:hypothetical protein